MNNINEIAAMGEVANATREREIYINAIMDRVEKHFAQERLQIAMTFYERCNNDNFQVEAELHNLKVSEESTRIAKQAVAELLPKLIR